MTTAITSIIVAARQILPIRRSRPILPIRRSRPTLLIRVVRVASAAHRRNGLNLNLRPRRPFCSRRRPSRSRTSQEIRAARSGRRTGQAAGLGSARPIRLDCLETGRFARETPAFPYWKSLDFLGFSRPKRDFSMGCAGFSAKKNLRAFSAASEARRDGSLRPKAFGPEESFMRQG